MFTYSYQQPDEYRFSLDSIHLAEFLATHLQSRTDLESLRVLDLCAGCGVVGIELSWYLRTLRQIDFVEVQAVYLPYFQKNVVLVDRPELNLQMHTINYEKLLETQWSNRYNLIVSNPPYFLAGQGVQSPSEFKNRCRFYLDSSFEKFILAIANALAEGGEAYFLLRSLKQHGTDLFAAAKRFLEDKNILIEKIADIRGTAVINLKKIA